jgi:hypothetical protein
MRSLTLLMFILLAIAASAVTTATPAAAQTGTADFSGGSSVIRTRSEGSYSPPRVTPPLFAELKLTFRTIASRYFSMRWTPAFRFELSAPADLPARRRVL